MKWTFYCKSVFSLSILFMATPSFAALQKMKDAFSKAYQRVFQSAADRDFLAAAKREDMALMTYLLENKGAHVNAHDERAITALMWAASYNKVSLARFLLSKGADVNAADRNGQTALMTAAFLGDIDIVSVLLKSGANIGAIDNKGRGIEVFTEFQPRAQEVIDDYVFAQNYAQPIAETFAQSKNDNEPLVQKPFTFLMETVMSDHPFFLAVLPVDDKNYHFFDANALAQAFAIHGVADPLNRAPVEKIMIYRYTGSRNNKFPFLYEETIHTDEQQLRHFMGRYGGIYVQTIQQESRQFLA